jgi:hypothetical protein
MLEAAFGEQVVEKHTFLTGLQVQNQCECG